MICRPLKEGGYSAINCLMAAAKDSTSQTPNPGPINPGPARHASPDFPFTRESAIRRFAEPAAFAFFPYVAGLTVMDDHIAAAVSRHSNFQSHVWSRLLGTIHASIVLIFGNEQEAYDMARHIHALHGTVKGSKENVSYHANDARAQTWVLAAVFSGAVEAKRRWNPPAFTLREEESLYQDFKVFGAFFGIHPDLLPANLEEFKQYWESRLNGNQLLRTGASREMARAVLRFKTPKILSPLGKVSQSISIISLDPRLQERSGLWPTASDKRISAGIDYMMRNTYGHLPDVFRTQAVPAYMAIQRAVTSVVRKFYAGHV